MSDDRLIKTIDEVYYQEHFDLQHLTSDLPQNLTSDHLLEYKGKLERLLNVVSKKVSELILNHQPTYVSELRRIADLQSSITESIRTCSDGRRCLRFIKVGTAKNGSTIVDHYKKRECLAKLLDSLTNIDELRRSVIEVRGLIDSQEDVPRAIQMCKDGKALLAPHNKFKCLDDLGSKLDDTMEQKSRSLFRLCAKIIGSIIQS